MSTELFQNINKFVSIEESEFEKIILYFSRENVKKKELLMCIGDKVLHEYFVLSGCLQMYFTDGEGTEHTVQFALKRVVACRLFVASEKETRRVLHTGGRKFRTIKHFPGKAGSTFLYFSQNGILFQGGLSNCLWILPDKDEVYPELF